MYSRTVGMTRALTLSSERGGDGVDHVAGDNVVGAADLLRRVDARASVDEGARGRGLERAEALREERADDAAQHVACPRRGERGGGAGADRDRAARCRDDRVVALQQHHGLAALRRVAGVVQAASLDLVGVDVEQAAELGGVRGEDGGRAAPGQVVDGERVQAVGVDQQWCVYSSDEGMGERAWAIAFSKPWTEDDSARPL